MVRAINLNPSEAEIQDMMKKVDANNSGQFNLESLESLIRERGKDPDLTVGALAARTHRPSMNCRSRSSNV